MNNVTWTKKSLAHALNTRMDQGKFGHDEFIMLQEISDELLVQWQEFYDQHKGNPTVVEGEFISVYKSIIAGF